MSLFIQVFLGLACFFFNLLNVLFSSVFRAKTRLCHVAMRWLSPDSVDHQEAHEGAKMLENNIQYGT